jgi:hypothetical protein
VNSKPKKALYGSSPKPHEGFGATHEVDLGVEIPGRVLLDTNIVNFILDWGEAIHDGGSITSDISPKDVTDIQALRDIWLTGQRASWQLAISPRTYIEVSATTDPGRRAALEGWFGELWLYWREFFDQYQLSDDHADIVAHGLVHSESLAVLPDIPDQELLAHAIAYGCDAFCTRDRKTILRHREQLTQLPIRILTPTEWWGAISPFASLWV